MRTVAVCLQKGGVGKTALVVNLAAALAEKKKRVLVVDLDAQANATSWLGCKDGGKGTFSVLVENAAMGDIVRPTAIPGLDIAPGSTWLVGVDRLLANAKDAEHQLRLRLAKLKGSWDVCIIDTPPALGLATLNALTAADELLVPVAAHVLSLQAVAALKPTLELVQSKLNRSLKVGGYVASRVDNRTKHAQEVVASLREAFGDDVYKTTIRECIRLAEAPSFGEPVTVYDTASPAAEDFRALATEFLKRGA